MVSPQTLRYRLKTKAHYLLWESAIPWRSTFEDRFLEPALECGRVGLVGGAIRDLAFQSVLDFKSDLDFVLWVEDRASFDRLISRLNVTQNAFGGYRTKIGGLQVDFWEASQSWAHLHGHYQVRSIADVRHTTFFNLDALIYDVGEQKLLADDLTIRDLLDRFLDINLRPNPNEDGAAVRALRRLRKHGLKASEALIEFIAGRIDASGWNALIRRDQEAFPHAPVLRYLFEATRPSGVGFSKQMQMNGGRLLPECQYEFDWV